MHMTRSRGLRLWYSPRNLPRRMTRIRMHMTRSRGLRPGYLHLEIMNCEFAIHQNAHDPFEGIETKGAQRGALWPPPHQNAHDPFEGIETYFTSLYGYSMIYLIRMHMTRSRGLRLCAKQRIDVWHPFIRMHMTRSRGLRQGQARRRIPRNRHTSECT